jgi:hypothetical protein
MNVNSAIENAFQTMQVHPDHQWMIRHEAFRRQIIHQIRAFPAAVLPDTTRPAFITGIVHNCGVAECWAVRGVLFDRYAKTVLRMQRQIAHSMYAALDLHRMHILIEDDDEKGHRWARAVGFEYETRLKRAGARGTDMAVYVFQPNDRRKSWLA